MNREDDIQKAIEQVNKVKPYFWKPPSEIADPLTLDVVEDVEEQLGHTLPDSYLAIMMIQNGGMPRYWAYGDASGDLSVQLHHGLDPMTDVLGNVNSYRDWETGHKPSIADKVVQDFAACFFLDVQINSLFISVGHFMHDALTVRHGHVDTSDFCPVSFRFSDSGLDFNDIRAQITQNRRAPGPGMKDPVFYNFYALKGLWFVAFVCHKVPPRS